MKEKRGRGKTKKCVLKFDVRDTSTNSLMGWESSDDTLGEVVIKFSSKEKVVLSAYKLILLEPKNKFKLLPVNSNM